MPSLPLRTAIAVSLPLLAATAVADTCRYRAERSAKIDGDGIRKVVVLARAGDLEIYGEPARTGVAATGKACASSQKDLDQINIATRREGDTVYVQATLPEPVERLFVFWKYEYLDLVVSVPQSATLSVEDTSGDLEIVNVQAATVTDSSGDQTLKEIAGDLEVTDSSGEIGIEQLGGNLLLNDSSGDVDIRDVKGNVEIVVDSSGDLNIEQVGGDVHIAHDSSGDIEIADVQRNVKIDSDSSGDIYVNGVGGDFDVSADGSGEITHERVAGATRLPQD